MSQDNKIIIEALIKVFDQLESAKSKGLEDQEIQALHLDRQRLTAQLYQTLPNPMPPQLEELVQTLHERTKRALESLHSVHHETREAILQLKQGRKASNAYQSVG